MFLRKTVFILGAGASWHYGYPTGEDLVTEVVERATKLSAYVTAAKPFGQALLPKFMVDGAIRQDYDEAKNITADLVTRIKAVDPLVIDYFLGQNPRIAAIGRLLIAWVILDRETAFNREGNVNRPTAAERKTKDN